MIFRFEKRGSNNWWHYNGTTQILNFSNWEIVFDEVSQSVNLQQLNGANVPNFNVPIADVRVKNLSGSDETYTTVALLRERLVALGYNPLVVGGGGSQNLAEVLAIGGRTIKRVTSTAYEFVATDKSEYLVIDEVGDDVVLSLDDSLFDNGDTIIGVGGVQSFTLTLDNPIGDINPIDTASFTINYLDEFKITKVGASTWILTITNYASNQSGGGASWGAITGTLSAQTDLQSALDGKQNKLVVVSSNTTASNDTNYNVVANATFTDPTPAEGKGYVVFVRNGTATIGGVGYAVGRIIYRVFHSGAWSSTIYVDQAYIDAKVADSITNGVTTIAPSQNAVFDALALKSDLASPTFTGTPLAPTPSANDNSTKIATTAYVDNSVVVTKVLSADVTTTSTTAVDTNLSHPIASSEILKFSCPLSVTTASGGVKLQITVPTGAVVTGGSAVAQGASTATRFLNLTANTLTTAVSTVALTSPMNLEFTVKNSTTAGNVIVSFASGTGGSTSILENSTMQIFKTQSV